MERRETHYHPFVHPDTDEYLEEAETEEERRQRVYHILRYVFTGLSQRFNDEVREFAHQEYDGDFNKLFAVTPLAGERPKISPAGGTARPNMMVSSYADQLYTSLPEFKELYSSIQGRWRMSPQKIGPITIASPIGAYGPQLSYSVVQAGRAVCTLTDIIRDDCDEVNSRYAATLQEGTFFEDANLIMREAASTTAAAFSLLVLEKVPGYEDDPVGLFEQCIDSAIFSRVAATAPFGLIFPMTSHLRGLPGLIADDQGGVSLPKETAHFLVKEREARGSLGPGSTNRTFGCPAAPDGIRYVAEIFHKALKYHYGQRSV